MKLTNGYIILTLIVSLFWLENVSSQTTNEEVGFNKPFIDSVIHYYHNRAWDVNTSNPSLAQATIDSAGQYTTKENQTSTLAQILEIKGGLYLANANFKEASLNYRKSINLYNQYPDLQHRSAFVQLELGTIFYKLGQYEEAIKLYQPTLNMFELADKHTKIYGKSLAYNNIGLCRLQLGDYSGAVTSFNNGLKYRNQIEKPELIAHSYAYFAAAYIKAGHFAKADSVLNKGFALSGIPANHIWLNKLMLQQGHLRVSEGKNREARNILESANKSIYTNGQSELTNELNHNLYELEFASGNYEQAYQYAQRGYIEALQAKDYSEAISFTNQSKQIALKEGAPEKALFFSERASRLKDTILVENSDMLEDLLALSNDMAKAERKNTELENTTSTYSNIIEDQKGLLVVSVVLILLLVLIAYIVTRVNAKLKNNEKNQRELNLRILAVINRTESQIISLGADGSIRVINKPAIEYFKKWIGIELQAGDILLDKLNGTDALQNWQQVLQKSKTIPHWKEVSQVQIKDKKHYFLENYSSITHKDGSYAGLVAVSNDITKEHEFNVRMSEQNDNLEKSNKAKERMLSILAHDLKDAVYSAHSLSELVLETPEEFPKEELIHLFSLLHGNFDKTKSLLDGLLDWMRAQTTGSDLKRTPFDLRNLVQEVFEACYPKSYSKKIKLTLDIQDDISVLGDREMIKTVLRNLVNNSIKYTQPEIGCINVFADYTDDIVSIHVQDNGQGISKENQKKLFQGPGKFTTVGTAKEQGTGFGLSLCKELIDLHKGELTLISEEGEGSDFSFTLPLARKNDLSKKQLH